MAGAGRRRQVGRIAYLLVGLLALGSGGCLLAVAGTAASGVAVGYVYFKGRMIQDFPAHLPDARNAMHSALAALHFPILQEEAKPSKVFLSTRTADGSKVRIHLEVVPSRIPAEGALTRVTVRVLPFGDDVVSARILDQTAYFLTTAGPPATPPPPPAVAPPAPPIRPISAPPQETTPPPLAPAAIAPVKR